MLTTALESLFPKINFNSKIWLWLCNYMSSKVCEENTYAFPNFSTYTVEVWEWINNDFILGFITDVIINQYTDRINLHN